eukprot:4941990-Alexandrium_andersonii.AAC.1
MQNRFERSNLELRGPRSGLKNGHQALEGCVLRRFFAQNPNPPMKAGLEGVRGRESADLQTSKRNPPICNPRNP